MNIKKSFKTISNAFSLLPKYIRTLFSGFVAMTVVLAGFGVLMAGWTPNRPVYDWNNVDQRQGSLDGPRINAFINTPYYGDERAFFDSRRTDQTEYKDVLAGVTGGSKKVVMRSYIHNGANQSTNQSGVGVAKDAKIRIDLPSGTSTALRARSYISISNPAPGYPAEVTDTTELVDTKPFSIEYVPGSAKIWTEALNGASMSDTIVSTGANLGYDSLNGQIPGCFEYQAIVEIEVEIKVADVVFEKEVRLAGQDTWKEHVLAKPGDKVEWLIGVENTGEAELNQVRVGDDLPDYLQVVPESVRWIYVGTDGSNQNVVQSDSDLFNGSVDFGDWNPGGGFYLRFDTLAQGNFDPCQIKLKNVATLKTKNHPNEIKDDASVTIIREDCDEPEDPLYSCDLLSATKTGKRSFTFKTSATAENGAQISRYFYNFGDDTDVFITDSASVDYTYAKVGQYVVGVQVEFNVDGELVVVDNADCKVIVTTDGETLTIVTPPTGKLPDTGPASMFAALFGTSSVGVALRNWLISRKALRSPSA